MVLTVYMIPMACDKWSISGGGVITPAASCNSLGSAAVVWERLQFQVSLPKYTNASIGAHQGGICGNAGGSYVTMVSIDGLMFGIINTVGNFGTVFVDQSYWQSAIAASPASAHKGYLLGGMVWFTIPFALATSLGLGGIATNAAIYPADSGAGLVPPATATVVIGQGGGILMIIMLFMAITSTGSAECIAVSSLIVYDVYRKYFNPEASGARILLMSRIVCAIFGILMGLVGVILNVFTVTAASFDADECKYVADCGGQGVGISLGWVYQFMGNAIGSAVLPVA